MAQNGKDLEGGEEAAMWLWKSVSIFLEFLEERGPRLSTLNHPRNM